MVKERRCTLRGMKRRSPTTVLHATGQFRSLRCDRVARRRSMLGCVSLPQEASEPFVSMRPRQGGWRSGRHGATSTGEPRGCNACPAPDACCAVAPARAPASRGCRVPESILRGTAQYPATWSLSFVLSSRIIHCCHVRFAAGHAGDGAAVVGLFWSGRGSPSRYSSSFSRPTSRGRRGVHVERRRRRHVRADHCAREDPPDLLRDSEYRGWMAHASVHDLFPRMAAYPARGTL